MKLCGKPMIVWVAEAAAKALGGDNTFVATDDRRIADTAEAYGYKAVMTSEEALTGTDRIAEASRAIDADIYVNIQGDEPLLDPGDIKKAVAAKLRFPAEVINCMCPVGPDEDPASVTIPKVVTTEDLRMVYMSRLAIPGSKVSGHPPRPFMKQVCIYAFSRRELDAFARFGRKGRLEKIEDIEILRFLELGIPVRMVEVSGGSKAVDIPEDVKAVESAMRERGL